MRQNTERIKYNKNNPVEVFDSVFSSDTWMDNYRNVHNNSELVETTVFEWKKRDILRKFKGDIYAVCFWRLTHDSFHKCALYVKGTYTDAIDALLKDEKYNSGWYDLHVGEITLLDVIDKTNNKDKIDLLENEMTILEDKKELLNAIKKEKTSKGLLNDASRLGGKIEGINLAIENMRRTISDIKTS